MPREVVTIECTEARKEGKSPSRYTTTRNKKLKTDKLKLGKDNPSVKASQTQLRKSEISLKQLQQTYKKGPKK